MSKYPVSCRSNLKVNEFFKEIIYLHAKEGDKVIDVTCGKRHIWEGFHEEFSSTRETIFTDIRDFEYNMVEDYNHIQGYDNYFDCIVFDPPYLFGIKAKKDAREEDYGMYNNTYEELMKTIETSPLALFNYLKSGGKVILKCSDMYLVKEKKFYPLSFYWMKSFSRLFDIIDIYVYVGRRLSGTAFQVKNRGCSVNNHSYFIVFRKKSP
jgi:DNA modification methylase